MNMNNKVVEWRIFTLSIAHIIHVHHLVSRTIPIMLRARTHQQDIYPHHMANSISPKTILNMGLDTDKTTLTSSDYMVIQIFNDEAESCSNSC